MLYLPEMSRLNNEFAAKGELTPQASKLPAINKGMFIIVVYTPNKRKIYLDKSGHFVNDPNMCNGWDEHEFDKARERAEILQNSLHVDCKVAVDKR